MGAGLRRENRIVFDLNALLAAVRDLDRSQIGEDMIGPERAEVEIRHIGMPDMDVFAEIIRQGIWRVVSENGTQGRRVGARALTIGAGRVAHAAL